MLTNDAIGQWAKRQTHHSVVFQIHVIDDVVGEAAIMACGRRMPLRTRAGSLAIVAEPTLAAMHDPFDPVCADCERIERRRRRKERNVH